jgi:hypothetical protein
VTDGGPAGPDAAALGWTGYAISGLVTSGGIEVRPG